MQMIKLIVYLIAFFGGLFSTQSSFAIVHFEPLAGYQIQNLKLVDLTNTTQEFKSDSPLFGAKFGLKTPFGISLDLVGTYSEGKAKSTPSVSQDPNFTQTVGSVQLGVSAMYLMKLYLGYIFSSESQIKSNSIFPGLKLSGTGYQAGLAFYFFRNWSLTFNYNVHQFKKVSGATYTIGDDVKSYYSKSDLADTSVYLSYSF